MARAMRSMSSSISAFFSASLLMSRFHPTSLLASRTFWRPQLAALAGTYRMAALDLAGHGDSSGNREHWSVAAWRGRPTTCC